MANSSRGKESNPSFKLTKKSIGAILGIACCLIICFLLPIPAGLTKKAMIGLGILVWAVVFMIFQVLPDYWTVLAMNGLWAITGTVKFEVAFETFRSQAWWILFCALSIGYAVSKTGLLKRIALHVLTIFPTTFRGQVLGMLCSSMVVNPFIPSTTVKVAVAAPFSRAISESMGYKSLSKGATGLFCAMFIGFSQMSLTFLSANVQAYLLYGFLPNTIQQQITWMTWFLGMIPWALIVFFGCYFFIMWAYKPTEETAISNTYVRDELKAMGSMSRDQRITLIVLCCALLLWATGQLHPFSAAMVALAALLVLILFGVISTKEFNSNLPWDTIFFLGGVTNIGVVVGALKIDKWVQAIINPYFSGLLNNLFLLIVFVGLMVVVCRFLIVSMNATMTIFSAILVPLCMGANLNPWPVMMTVFAFSNIWLVRYQNAVYLAGFYAAGGDMVDHGPTVKMSVAYMACALIGFMVSVPYWDMLGILHLH